MSTHDGEKSGKISDSMTGYKSTECVLTCGNRLALGTLSQNSREFSRVEGRNVKFFLFTLINYQQKYGERSMYLVAIERLIQTDVNNVGPSNQIGLEIDASFTETRVFRLGKRFALAFLDKDKVHRRRCLSSNIHEPACVELR